MAHSSSESLHEEIERALQAGDFDRTRELSTALGQAIISEARAASPVERTKVVESGLSRLREHVSLARVLRAHIASQLRENTTLSLYQSDADGRHSWGFDA